MIDNDAVLPFFCDNHRSFITTGDGINLQGDGLGYGIYFHPWGGTHKYGLNFVSHYDSMPTFGTARALYFGHNIALLCWMRNPTLLRGVR